MTDREMQLIEDARNGELTAFKEIMEQYQQQIYYLAFDMTGNHHDAEDLTQEVFIKAYHALPKFRGDAKISSWLYRIAVNTGIDKMRKKQKVATKMSEDVSQFEQETDHSVSWHSPNNPEDQVESGMIQHHIETALKKLSPRERSVFVLRHYNELPIKEIAKILDISVGTVKSLIFRSVKKLQEELAFYRNDLGMEELK